MNSGALWRHTGLENIQKQANNNGYGFSQKEGNLGHHRGV